jgi:hypothetical protein
MQKGPIARDSTVDFAQPAFPDQAKRKTIEFASRLNRGMKWFQVDKFCTQYNAHLQPPHISAENLRASGCIMSFEPNPECKSHQS